jgi:diaminopimelate decarboxylase
MQHFHYKNNQIYGESVRLADIAEEFGTPCYVYSEAMLEDSWQGFESAFKGLRHKICYAVKANSNIAILNFFAKKGAGFDIVSQGELERVLAAKGDPKKIVFSGVGKQTSEIVRALEVGIACFDVESLPELERIHSIAEARNTIATVALRVNPDIDARTHPYISTGLSTNKFGIEYSDVLSICHKIQKMPHIKLVGIACHIGSQLTELSPFLEASDRMLDLLQQLKTAGIELTHVNIGGGLGVQYRDEKPPTLQEYAEAVRKKFENQSIELIIEPGRALVANAGILLTKVEYIKTTSHKNFAIVDAGMNDLIRPALYDAWHDILPINLRYGDTHFYDIVGPVCESSDVIGKSRQIALEPGDILAIKSAGAYGFSMSSNYNSRPRPVEVMIKDGKAHLIRRRETLGELFANEALF